MSSVFPVRRSAERFQAALEASPDPTDAPSSYAEFLRVVADLQTVEAPAPRPEFVTDLRAQLMAEAETALKPVSAELTLRTSPRTAPRRHQRKVAIAASALAFVGASTSVAMASQSALPGDALYPIKRAIEGAQTGLASGDRRTAELLDNAETRLDEATALAEQRTNAGDAQVPGAVSEFQAAAVAAGDAAIGSDDGSQIEVLRAFTADSMADLTTLEGLAPQASNEVLSAARTLMMLDAQARAACPTCGGAPLQLPFALTAAGLEGSSAGITADTPALPQVPGLHDQPVGGPAAQPHPDHEPPSGDQDPGTDGTDEGTGSDPGGDPVGDGPTLSSDDSVGDVVDHVADDLLGDGPTSGSGTNTSTGTATGTKGVTDGVKEGLKDTGSTVGGTVGGDTGDTIEDTTDGLADGLLD